MDPDRSDLGDWKDAEGLMLGGNPFFDRLFWVRGHATMPDGCLMLTDHEGDPPLPIVARSLAEYLARICFFNGVDLASVPGERDDMPLEQTVLFAREFAELNTQESGWSEWAERALMRKQHPHGHPLGYHHWDKAAKRLVPIGEAGDVRNITIEIPSSRDLESIAAAGRCERLMLIKASTLDVAPLAHLHTLDQLYVYDVTDIDAAPLAACPRLRDMCFLRCQVRGLAALANSPTLTRVRLNECRFSESELAALRRGRPGIGIER